MVKWSVEMACGRRSVFEGRLPSVRRGHSHQLRRRSARLLCVLVAATILVTQVCCFQAIAAHASLDEVLTQQLQVNRQRW
ncbi:putative membrane protein [Xanthomonas bromi]|uniref:Putative membrane protein n=1 Tax=Xanthomonas bromi TaxID=56449 RepID=A0A1C3NMW8_9XANT|nr:hypothetical protein [Xanthomonas bromi]SBV51756.1 putative membrane protein [Xanthomonas bromi]